MIKMKQMMTMEMMMRKIDRMMMALMMRMMTMTLMVKDDKVKGTTCFGTSVSCLEVLLTLVTFHETWILVCS